MFINVITLFPHNLSDALSFVHGSLPAALLMSLLSVTVLIGLFAYLNYYTRRRYFCIWMVAWLFYALWLWIPFSFGVRAETPWLTMAKLWAISVAALFLLWGSAEFLKWPASQRLLGLFLVFLLVWSYVGTFQVGYPEQVRWPVFCLIALASVLTAGSFWRLRRQQPRYLGAGLLSAGFLLWGGFLAGYPIFFRADNTLSAGFFISGVLQLFIAVSMIVLVLEEMALRHERIFGLMRKQRTQQRALRAQMRVAEDRYRHLLDQADEAILIAAADDLRFLKLNPKAERMLGLRFSESSCLFLPQFFASDPAMPASHESVDAWLSWLTRQRQFNLVRKDGGLIPADGNGAPITYEGQVAYQFVFRDLTEQRNLEAQFLRAQRLDAIGKISSGIAHDLNNVLTPILASLQLLRERITDASSQSLLATLETGTRRGASMVKQLLTFGRGAEGRRVLVQPRLIVQEVAQIARETFPKSMMVTASVPEHLWSIQGDVTQLHQVLFNLCLNARDAMPHGGKLTLAAANLHLDTLFARMNPEANPGPHVMVSVLDTGTGITSENRDKIFEPFFTTKESGKGTGLGLSTALTIVKAHGGFVQVNSELGQGTEFKIFLPATPSNGPQTTTPEPAFAPRGQDELILLVDDEEPILLVLQQILEEHQYQILVAKDGQEAVTLARNHLSQLRGVVVDLMMPVMDGTETVRRLLELEPRLPIIVMSGMALDIPMEQMVSESARAFLAKPFTTEELLVTLNQVLRS